MTIVCFLADAIGRHATYESISFTVPDDAAKVNYRRLSFMSKFLELNYVMWMTNNGLTDHHTFDSRPDAWPRLRRGIVRLLLSYKVCSNVSVP